MQHRPVHSLRRVVLLALLALLSLTVGAGTVAAQDREVIWERYDVALNIQANGDLIVVEDWRIRFEGGPFSEGFAEIPLQFTGGISDIGVFEDGVAYTQGSSSRVGEFEVLRDSEKLQIFWGLGSTTNQTRNFKITYRVYDALRIYDDGDVLQWTAIPDNLGSRVEQASVTVTVPNGAEIVATPESIGVRTEWQSSTDNTSVTFTALNAFTNDGLGVRVVFTHGIVPATPPAWQQSIDFQEQYKPLVNIFVFIISALLLFAGPAAAYLLWYLRGRDPQVGPVPEYITEPPSDLPPGVVGTLVDETADMRDVTATLLDLAARGHMRMEEREKEGAFGTKSQEYVFVRNAPNELTESDTLRPYEATLMKAFFNGKDERSVSRSLPESFFSALPRIQQEMYKDVTERGWFRNRPDQVRGGYTGLAILVIIVAFGVGALSFAGLAAFSDLFWCPSVAMGAMALAFVAVVGRMPAKTRDGAQQAALWKAFQTYLENIKKYADLNEAADQFERYLPYAVAFGLERRWIGAFTTPQITAPVPMPHWYRPVGWHGPYMIGRRPGSGAMAMTGPGSQPLPTLNQGGLAGSMNRMGQGLIDGLNSAGRTISTPPQTSTYSGGGSRGFSGGSRGFSGGGGFRSSGGGGSRGFR